MSTSTKTGTGYPGQAGLGSFATQYNLLEFVIRQHLGRLRTASLVKVMSCTNTGAVTAVGSVDVQPLVNLMDGLGIMTPHAPVFNVPYFRMQGGTNAVIMDPQEGDIGIAVFADRDISLVKSTQGQANPASYRRFNIADALYIGGVLNGVPDQYVRFTSTGIDVADKNGNTMNFDASGITINGVLIDRSANISGAGTVDASGEGTFNGHTVGAHTHAVTTAPGTTSTPTG